MDDETSQPESDRSRWARGFLEAALDSIIIADLFGNVVEFNRSAEQTFGYSRNIVLGRPLEELIIPPASRHFHHNAFERFATTGEQRLFGRRLEMTGMRSDGSEFPVELAISLIEGDPPLICGAVRDLTRQKEAEDGLRKLADEQAALRRVATLVARGEEPSKVFEAVCAETGELIGAAYVKLLQFTPDGLQAIVAEWNSLSPPPDPRSPIDLHTVPVILKGQTWGALVAGLDDKSPSGTEARVTSLAELIATAVSSAAARSDLLASRVRIVTAGDEARQRIQRDMHDGAQQHFVNSVMQLQFADERFESNPETARAALRSALLSAKEGLQNVRELAAGLHPSILTIGGLRVALEALAARSGLPVIVHAPDLRYARQIEVASYFVVAEALANVSKHAKASHAVVEVSDSSDELLIAVRDDGMGGASRDRGTGIRGLQDRVEALGGTFHINSPVGGGTFLEASLPLPSQ